MCHLHNIGGQVLLLLRSLWPRSVIGPGEGPGIGECCPRPVASVLPKSVWQIEPLSTLSVTGQPTGALHVAQLSGESPRAALDGIGRYHQLATN